MRIDGEWYRCSDGIIRPTINVRVRTGDGAFLATYFLVDTGADRTVLDGATFEAAGLRTRSLAERLGGLGGTAESVVVETELSLPRERDDEVVFRGSFHALTSLSVLDMPVLGRDILDLFALIVDRPSNLVCLLGQRHRYRIVQQ